MLTAIFKLLRPQQWYKNFMIFLPIVFSMQLFNSEWFLASVWGFIALCLVSSANYVLNDIVDRKRDAIHPEKKHRPIASGRISTLLGSFIFVILLVIGLLLGMTLTLKFTIILGLLFVLTLVYSTWLKHVAFADILVIGVNFILRAGAGVYVIVQKQAAFELISPWLILCPFFLALFLASGKRYADLALLGEKAKHHKKVLSVYTKDTSRQLILISTTLLVISYSLYTVLGQHIRLLITLPFALYAIFRVLYIFETKPETARKAELIIKDKGVLIGGILWFVTGLIAIYFPTLLIF
jgi:4-hydroxybenzoate polyprenyltransferase